MPTVSRVDWDKSHVSKIQRNMGIGDWTEMLILCIKFRYAITAHMDEPTIEKKINLMNKTFFLMFLPVGRSPQVIFI